MLLTHYVEEHNKEGAWAGDLEYSAISKLFKLKIILLKLGYIGYNIYNIFCNDDYNSIEYQTLYINYVNDNHFNYMEQIIEKDDERLGITKIDKMIDNNLKEREKIRTREYPICFRWSANLLNEMFTFYKYNILPEERIEKTKNKSLYTIRFKELAKNKFYFTNDRLFYIKNNNSYRLNDGTFIDINKVELKKILFIYEILPLLEDLHKNNGHMPTNKFKDLLYKSDYFIDGLDILIEYFCKECPECFVLNYGIALPNAAKLILEEGPHYRMLIDITYLEKSFYDKKTKYKYIIDSIDHFSKFFWGFLIEDKKSITVLKKIKMFIQINKKPIVIQTDNGLEFKNKMLYDYLEKENIKIIHSRPHHPQTNGCIERYHREVHKFMKNYLKDYEDFSDNEVEEALNEYIIYHNEKKKKSTQYSPNDIRDINDSIVINKILENIFKSFKPHILNNVELIDIDEKILLWNNIILKNNIYSKDKNKNYGSFQYPCVFVKYISSDVIEVNFEINIKDLFKLNKSIKVDISCAIIIPEFVYNYYKIKINKEHKILNFLSLDNINNVSEDMDDYMIYQNIDNKNDNENNNFINNKNSDIEISLFNNNTKNKIETKNDTKKDSDLSELISQDDIVPDEKEINSNKKIKKNKNKKKKN